MRKKLPAGAFVGGLDEVGRGPLAGPVMAACVVLDKSKSIPGLSDSKKLTPKKREVLFDEIREKALAFGVATVEAGVIDEMNILRASLHAMKLAFELCNEQLEKKGHPHMLGAVVDGNQLVTLPDDVTQVTVIKGDDKSQPIMAASILAKVARDRRMADEHERFPVYGFKQHKGYPTKAHREALEEHGACVIHRRSFAPVRNAVAQGNLLKT
ncbi:MAG: ribonuclease HII [Deltaproteobacteria bacterium]|nr:ribonuclease HII [Deltaproteobacteria bacterium]